MNAVTKNRVAALIDSIRTSQTEDQKHAAAVELESIVEDIVDGIDMTDVIEDAVESAVEKQDFSDSIKDAVDERDMTYEIEEALDSYEGWDDRIRDVVKDWDFSDIVEDADLTKPVGEALDDMGINDEIEKHREQIGGLYDTLIHAGFIGRLRWLLTGKVAGLKAK